MTQEEFVQNMFKEKEDFIREYLSSDSKTKVSELIKSLNLTKEQQPVLKEILDKSFTDIFYTILLGLDGSASIGGVQEDYTLHNEDGDELTGGEITGFAYEYFHEN